MNELEKPFIILHDDRKLRGAALESLIHQWRPISDLDVRRFSRAPDIRDLDPAGCRMCIVDVGQQSLEGVSSRVAVALMRALFPDAPVVVLSDNMSSKETLLAQQSGVQGFVPADTEPAVLFAALDLIMSGGTYIPRPTIQGTPPEEHTPPAAAGGDQSPTMPEPLRGVIPGTGDEAGEPGCHNPDGTELRSAGGSVVPLHANTQPQLTARQEDVLAGLHAGKSNKAIARDLDLSEATVKIHVRQLMRKLGVANRTQVAVITMRKDKPTGELRGTRAERGPLLWIRPPEVGARVPN